MARCFKVTLHESYGRSGRHYGYESCNGTGMSRSPKRAVELAREAMREDARRQCEADNHALNGCLVMSRFVMWKDGKVILEKWR